MAELSRDIVLAIAATILTLLLVVLDKAGKLKGPVLLWLLLLAALMTVPLALGNPLAASAPAAWRWWVRGAMMAVVLFSYWAIAIWISPMSTVVPEGEIGQNATEPPAGIEASVLSIDALATNITYKAGTRLGDVEWRNGFTDIRLTLENISGSPIQNLSLTVQVVDSDGVLFDMGQMGNIPGVEFHAPAMPNMSVQLVGKDGQASTVTTRDMWALASKGKKMPSLGREYRLFCPRLIPKTPLILVVATGSNKRELTNNLRLVGSYELMPSAGSKLVSIDDTISVRHPSSVTTVPAPTPKVPVAVPLMFKDSPLFTSERRRQISDDVNASAAYLRELGLPIPGDLPPIGVDTKTPKAEGWSFNSRSGDKYYYDQFTLQQGALEKRHKITEAFLSFVVGRFLYAPSPPVPPNLGQMTPRQFWEWNHTPEAMNRSYKTMGGVMLTQYLNHSYWNQDFEKNERPVCPDEGNGVAYYFWQMRERFGKEFTDKLAIYTLRALVDKPYTEIDATVTRPFRKYFYERLKLADSVIDNEASRMPGIDEILSKCSWLPII